MRLAKRSVALMLVLSASAAACSVASEPAISPAPEATPAPAPQPETEPEPEPEPEPEASSVDEDQQRVAWAGTVEAQRGEWIAGLEDTWDAESVDRLEFDGDALVVGITSCCRSSGGRQDAAWAIARELRVLWTDDAWPSDIPREPVWFKDLLLTVDDLRYECSGETMRQLAERRLERSEWEAACR